MPGLMPACGRLVGQKRKGSKSDAWWRSTGGRAEYCRWRNGRRPGRPESGRRGRVVAAAVNFRWTSTSARASRALPPRSAVVPARRAPARFAAVGRASPTWRSAIMSPGPDGQQLRRAGRAPGQARHCRAARAQLAGGWSRHPAGHDRSLPVHQHLSGARGDDRRRHAAAGEWVCC